MSRISVIVVAIIMATVIFSTYINFALYTLGGYGIYQNDVVNNTPINNTVNQLNVYPSLRNQTFGATSFAPGQPNSVPIDSASASSTIQRSGFVSGLKIAYEVLTFIPSTIQAYGSFYDIPSIVIDMLIVIYYIMIFLLVAGMFLYRVL